MTKRSLYAAFLALIMAASPVLATPEQQPNIILILADDLGVETINSYGGESYPTPELDRIASEGMRFENAHAQPLCTPSRVKLMTGKHNFRNYQHFMYLDPSETTFAHSLKRAGYRTMISGKWQLVDNGVDDIEGMLPQHSGFDDYFLWQVRRDNAGSRYWGPRISDNGELTHYPDEKFGPDLFNRQVTDYIKKASELPFFIYYTMTLPHLPLVTTPDSLDAVSKEEQFSGMVAYMDKLVGQVKNAVVEQGIAENTVILFIGDNGTDRRITSLRDGIEVAGGKGKTSDNGSHVPFIAWWPNTINPAQIDHNLINLSDFFPTLMELAGIDMPAGHPKDGISLVDVFKGTRSAPLRSEQFIHYNPQWMQWPARYAFDAQWKLYEGGELYNTSRDTEEKTNLMNTNLDKEASDARDRLNQKLASIPGGPVPFWPTAPQKVYVMAAVIVLGMMAVLALIFLTLHRRLRH